MIHFDTLSSISMEHLYDAFSAAFADYEIQISFEELNRMLKRRGYDPSLSFGAFDDGKLVAFTLNGLGIFDGLPTAYDTGTGTLPNYRGKGLASSIFQYSIPFLKDAGVEQYLLEVLQHNQKAIDIYQKQGFRIARELKYFRQPLNELTIKEKHLFPHFTLRKIRLFRQNHITQFWDFTPSWQNGLESISRSINDFLMAGIFEGSKLVGYCIFDPETGDIAQIAVDREYRRMGLGSILLKDAVHSSRVDFLKLINTEDGCDSIDSFAAAAGLKLCGKQYEMVMSL